MRMSYTSFESGVLTRIVDPRAAPSESLKFSIHFEKGIPVKLEVGSETTTGSLELFKAVSKIGPDHGVGRVDIKSRGFYNAPGLPILPILTSRVSPLIATSATSVISSSPAGGLGLYNDTYFSPERGFLENSVTFSQKGVNGKVNMMAYKGDAYVIGHSSKTSNLYSESEASIDTLEGLSPEDTSWVQTFLNIEKLRLVLAVP
ncbi:hypothetical protein ANO14919_048760 [Xylariales sp. No.14919]|nr:hypothetical protein ANO14919_048760 [Xylariales sp. No.14919]